MGYTVGIAVGERLQGRPYAESSSPTGGFHRVSCGSFRAASCAASIHLHKWVVRGGVRWSSRTGQSRRRKSGKLRWPTHRRVASARPCNNKPSRPSVTATARWAVSAASETGEAVARGYALLRGHGGGGSRRRQSSRCWSRSCGSFIIRTSIQRKSALTNHGLAAA